MKYRRLQILSAVTIFSVAFLSAALLPACSEKASGEAAMDSGMHMEKGFAGRAMAMSMPVPDEPPPDDDASGAPEVKNRVLVYRADLSLEVTDAEAARTRISELALEMGGYVQSASNRSVTVRIPAPVLEDAMTKFGNLGKVTEKNITADDVTGSYRDLEMRIANLEKARERYVEILKRATAVQDVLAVERELERVTSELEMYRAQFRRLHERVSLSTVTIRLIEEKELKRPGPLGWVFKGLYLAVAWLFVWPPV